MNRSSGPRSHAATSTRSAVLSLLPLAAPMLIWVTTGPVVTAQQSSSPRLESSPLLRGWLVESLHHDVDRAAALYADGATRDDLGIATRALCAARLADLELARGRDERQALDPLLATMRELALPLAETPQFDPSIAQLRAELRAAQAITEPAARAAALTRFRERAQAAANPGAPRQRGDDAQPRSAFDTVRRAVAPDHAAESRDRWLQEARRTSSGFRRDWLEVVELVLAGRIEEADRVAWYRLRFRPDKPAGDPVAHAHRSLEMLAAAIQDRRDGTRDREVLELLRDRIRDLTQRGEAGRASELLRHVPYLPR